MARSVTPHSPGEGPPCVNSKKSMVPRTFVRSSAPQEHGSEGCAYTSQSGPSLPGSIPSAAKTTTARPGDPWPRRYCLTPALRLTLLTWVLMEIVTDEVVGNRDSAHLGIQLLGPSAVRR